MIEPKPQFQSDRPKKGCGIGCLGIGCIGAFVLMVVVCSGGYYGLFHSSLPLMLIEQAIEQDGDVEIEGLEGSLLTGFSADELRFKSDGEQWSSLTDIKFKYNGGISIFGSDRLLISEISVNGGTIYANWDPEDNEIDFSGSFSDEISEELNDEFRREAGGMPNFKEVKIGLVRVANLKIVNLDNDMEIVIDEIKYSDFHWENGRLKSLGELIVKSSELDIDSVPSVDFAEESNALRLEGVLRKRADHRLLNDVRFVFDLAVDDDLEMTMRSQQFDGKIQIDQLTDETVVTYDDFSPSQFFKSESGAITASEINVGLKYEERKKQDRSASVKKEGSFKIGKTKFDNLKISDEREHEFQVVGEGVVDGIAVTASIRIGSPYSPFIDVALKSEEFESSDELWAKTIFGKPFGDLNEEQQGVVRASMPARKTDQVSSEDADEPEADSASPESGDSEAEDDIDDSPESGESGAEGDLDDSVVDEKTAAPKKND